MIYFYSFLAFLFAWALTPILAGITFLTAVVYLFLGFLFGAKYIYLGIGAVVGCILNIYLTNYYILNKKPISNGPERSIMASSLFVVGFIIAIVARFAFNINFQSLNFWYLLPFVFVIWIIYSVFLEKRRKETVDSFCDGVVKYKIAAKYLDDPKWAIYLYSKNGKEGWNQTIPGSFLAKHPGNDLTFVYSTREKALEYAQDNFKNAESVP